MDYSKLRTVLTHEISKIKTLSEFQAALDELEGIPAMVEDYQARLDSIKKEIAEGEVAKMAMRQEIINARKATDDNMASFAQSIEDARKSCVAKVEEYNSSVSNAHLAADNELSELAKVMSDRRGELAALEARVEAAKAKLQELKGV